MSKQPRNQIEVEIAISLLMIIIVGSRNLSRRCQVMQALRDGHAYGQVQARA